VAFNNRNSSLLSLLHHTDKEWVAHTPHALAWMVPGEPAKKWAAG
jgi:hypothetical protein